MNALPDPMHTCQCMEVFHSVVWLLDARNQSHQRFGLTQEVGDPRQVDLLPLLGDLLQHGGHVLLADDAACLVTAERALEADPTGLTGPHPKTPPMPKWQPDIAQMDATPITPGAPADVGEAMNGPVTAQPTTPQEAHPSVAVIWPSIPWEMQMQMWNANMMLLQQWLQGMNQGEEGATDADPSQCPSQPPAAEERPPMSNEMPEPAHGIGVTQSAVTLPQPAQSAGNSIVQSGCQAADANALSQAAVEADASVAVEGLVQEQPADSGSTGLRPGSVPHVPAGTQSHAARASRSPICRASPTDCSGAEYGVCCNGRRVESKCSQPYHQGQEAEKSRTESAMRVDVKMCACTNYRFVQRCRSCGTRCPLCLPLHPNWNIPPWPAWRPWRASQEPLGAIVPRHYDTPSSMVLPPAPPLTMQPYPPIPPPVQKPLLRGGAFLGCPASTRKRLAVATSLHLCSRTEAASSQSSGSRGQYQTAQPEPREE